MARTNYAGYYLMVQGVPFNNPSPKRETFKYAPELVMVGESYRLASGLLHTSVLPHTAKKVWVELPPLTQAQYQTYWNALHADAGGKGMYLTCRVYNDATDSYDEDTFYHNDLMVKPVSYGGQMMYIIEAFELIGH